MTNTQRHIDELYKTGKTTFRDNLGAYPDYVVSYGDMVARWAISSTEIIGLALIFNTVAQMKRDFSDYVTDELKQLCIDYYGEP